MTADQEILLPNQKWLDSLPAVERESAVLRLADRTDMPGPPLRWPMDWVQYRTYLASELPRLTMETTRRCTLRCDYCIYSGNYQHVRTHEALDMAQEAARQCIRFYASHSTKATSRLIRFYGGEALLNFHVIQDSVAYANRLCRDKPLRFSISTNGTALTDEVITWLARNRNVVAAITLNGPEHDQHRCFPSGEGSLSVIMDNIRTLRARYPDVWEKQIHLIANITSDVVLPELRLFYSENVGKIPTVITGIFPYGGNEIIRDIVDRRGRHQASAFAYCQTGDVFLAAKYQHGVESIACRPITKEGAFHTPGGCCMPFQGGIFVAADGTFGMCERTSPSVQFGDLQKGLCEDALRVFLQDAIELFERRCQTCWGRRLCDICFSFFMDDRGLPDEIPEEVCRHQLEQIEYDLQMYSSIVLNNKPLLYKLRYHH